MSARSMKRARERQVAKEQKRSERLGRRSKAALGAGAALGATVLFAPSANADQFTVNTLADGPTSGPGHNGTLRDALYDADNTQGHDVVSFDPALNGTITLTEGQLRLYEDTEIVGPGRDVITVSGADQSRVFYMSPGSNPPSVISGLTITGGNSGDANGGGIFVYNGNLELDDVLVTGNTTIANGGGIFALYSGLEIHDSTISGNNAGGPQNSADGGGIWLDQEKYDFSIVDIRNTTISGNDASDRGGGVYFQDLYSGGTIRDSVISGNDAGSSAGGIYLQDLYEQAVFTVEGTEVSGNTAGDDGGGMRLGGEDSIDGTMIVEDSTVSGNTATDDGGGIYLYSMDNDSGQLLIRGSTLSGNTATEGEGGGLAVDDSNGLLRFHRSTVSGNTAGTRGGGVYLRDVVQPGDGYDTGVAQFRDSTIASNSAAEGGGIFNFYDDVLLRNTIAADNTNDDIQELRAPVLAEAHTFLLDFSLVEDVGDAADVAQQTAGSNILGQDPQLGPLADNGGPTQTHAPAFSSPAVDKGSSTALIDQRGATRPFDQPDVANPNLPGADGSDMGAVELQAAPPVPEGSCLGQAATVVLAPADEVTFGTAGRDVIVGDAAANEIRGRGGNDLICGKGGRDQIGGGPDNDVVLGNAGNDVISGDQDDDRLTGSDGNDKISGATGNDRMYGVAGRDRLTGAAGNDHLNGGAADDVLIGASGADNLFGGPGNDRLNGGKGVDNLAGGGGRDQEIQQRR